MSSFKLNASECQVFTYLSLIPGVADFKKQPFHKRKFFNSTTFSFESLLLEHFTNASNYCEFSNFTFEDSWFDRFLLVHLRLYGIIKHNVLSL